MESNIKASFIPDKMPTAGQGGRMPKVSGVGSAGDIFILIAIVALAASLALAAGVFLYGQFLTANVQKKSEQLERARQAFDPALIQELVRLDARLQAADDVLARHLAPSELFNLLEELTLQSVSYDSLNYSVNDEGTAQIKLRGKARSVNGVALQASVFGESNAISNPIFSALDLVSDGVKFDVSADLNSAALRYTTIFSEYSAGVDSALNDTSILTIPSPGDQNQNTETPPDNFGSFGGDITQ